MAGADEVNEEDELLDTAALYGSVEAAPADLAEVAVEVSADSAEAAALAPVVAVPAEDGRYGVVDLLRD